MHSFATNCTIPPKGTNFVSAANIRGTLQILWSSISVLILCTWSVVHLNVPPQTIARTTTQKIKRTLNRFFTKVGWMVFNILAPEWIITKAWLDWVSVRRLRSEFMAQAAEDNVPWSDVHTHFANMGGFGFSFQHLTEVESIHGTGNATENSGPADESSLLHRYSLRPSDWEDWAQKVDAAFDSNHAINGLHCANGVLKRSKADSQGWRIDEKNSRLIFDMSIADQQEFHRRRNLDDDIYMSVLILQSDHWILDAAQLLKARELGIIDRLPCISEDDLRDRDNSNLFVKVLAIGQTMWFVLQFFVRFANGQPNTQLEVMVFAFAICSIAVYVLSWNRPKDPEYTIVAPATRHPKTGIEMLQIAAKASDYVLIDLRSTIWYSNTQIPMDEQAWGGSFYIYPSIFASIFGALHCIAWNFAFPTRIDQIMWQVTSITTVVSPILFLAFGFTVGMQGNRPSGIFELIWNIPLYLAILFPLIFIASRLFILIEVFRSLGFQPPEAFQTTWLNDIPHFG